jgi:hypothetical protein
MQIIHARIHECVHTNKGDISISLAVLCLSIKTTLHVVSLSYSTKSKINSVYPFGMSAFLLSIIQIFC